MPLFRKDGDYLAFERILIKALEKAPAPPIGLLPDAQPLAYGSLA